ncbi:MAG: capsule biosynthesis protein CapA [Pseudomonadota bacterium]
MLKTPSPARVFLFLQGPHGPFFHNLGSMMARTGAKVFRVGFNAGDRAFWWHRGSYISYRGTPEDWPDRLRQIIDEKTVTDIVLYGDIRPIHAEAVKVAEAADLRIHVFEEGYLRPYWVTYERGGSNGNSRLMDMPVANMRSALCRSDGDVVMPPAHWGDMRQHVFYGALYHFCVLALNRGYANFRPHRQIGVAREFRLYLLRLLFMPLHALHRILATFRIGRGGFPYHVALLQLEHDSNFQAHASVDSMAEFLDRAIKGFAEGAPTHHHLVFKAHPLEDGRVPLRRQIRALARKYAVRSRVHYVRGGKLARLLDGARSAVTVNSTAAQQVLWRGLPLRTFGKSVYEKPEFVSDQPLAHFFADPVKPDVDAYKDYRRYLLQTSQLPGGYYSVRGRQQLLRNVVDLMLTKDDPYQIFEADSAAPEQHLRLVGTT